MMLGNRSSGSRLLDGNLVNILCIYYFRNAKIYILSKTQSYFYEIIISFMHLILEEISPEELSKKLKPPRLKYVPTVELMREQIIRAWYIKDVDKFIKENTEFKLTL